MWYVLALLSAQVSKYINFTFDDYVNKVYRVAKIKPPFYLVDHDIGYVENHRHL